MDSSDGGLKPRGGRYLPVLVITPSPAPSLRALQAGPGDSSAKPFDLVECRTRIRIMLEVPPADGQVEKHNSALEETVRSAPPSCARAKRAIAA